MSHRTALAPSAGFRLPRAQKTAALHGKQRCAVWDRCAVLGALPVHMTGFSPRATPRRGRFGRETAIRRKAEAGLAGVPGAPVLPPIIQGVAQALQLLCGCLVPGNPGNVTVECSGGCVRGFVIQLRNHGDQPVQGVGDAPDALLEIRGAGAWIRHSRILSRPRRAVSPLTLLPCQVERQCSDFCSVSRC